MKPALRNLLAAAAASGMIFAVAAVAQDFSMSRWTIDGGGTMFSTDGRFELSGTIGQPDAQLMTAPPFELSAGFWFPLEPADCNSDGAINLADYGDFASCMKGPDEGVAAGCACFDVNRSGSVDLLDFAIAQSVFTGS